MSYSAEDTGDSPDIETGADTLLSFLEEKTKWPVSKIAKEMGVPKDTVKKWAKALEKSGLVEIKYSALKGMVLEYASDKSYEELNTGRSEFALEADELDIEVDEVEEVETPEDEEIAETEHEAEEEEESGEEAGNEPEDVSEESEEEGEESEEREDKYREESGEEDIKESEEESEFERKELESFSEEERSEGDVKADSGEISTEEGKEKLKNKLEDLENSEEEGEPGKAKLKAKKANIRKSGVGEGTHEEGSESEEDSRSRLDRIHRHVSSESGEKVEHSTGESLEEILESIKELGDLLRNDEVDNSEVYSRLEQEMEALKNIIKEEDITDEMKREVSTTMEKVEKDIENADREKGFLGKIIERLRGVLP